jgi:hypothetical protein
MNKQPAIDRELLIPILIGGLSVVGIIAVLMIGRSRNTPAEVAMTPSATPFQYIYLGTEPAITTLVVEGSEFPLSEEPITDEPVTDDPVFITPTRSSVSTPIILTSPNTTRTATAIVLRTSTSGGPPDSGDDGPPVPTATWTASTANTYDDANTSLSYEGSWVVQTGLDESGPNPAYQGTLHISSTTGNSVSFYFSGQEIHLFYQSGPSLGSILITFDGEALGETVNQAQGSGEWTHTLDRGGSHTIKIEHTSGGSVNIDRFVIPAPTPTPTRTPTQ